MSTPTRRHVPVLIIGSGVAGCTAALTLADAGHDVLLINAGEDLADGNSELAQGGIIYRAAPSTAIPDDARALEKDILVAGHDYNYRKAVRYLCRQGPRCVERMLMERAGVEFDRNPDGSFNLTREGGHAAPRILHRADYSGKAIMDGLTAQVRKHPRITRLHRRAAIDLLTSHHQARTSQYRYEVGNRCLGAYVLNEESGEPETILADWTVLATGGVDHGAQVELRSVDGGMLVQEVDHVTEDPATFTFPTDRKPTDAEMAELEFAWKVCKGVKSNAILVSKGKAGIGMGPGQPNRVDSALLACERAEDFCEREGVEKGGFACASDAFFPFRDNVDVLAAHGVTCIIQPGGSKRDDESIQACNEHGIAMVFTGARHFRH